MRKRPCANGNARATGYAALALGWSMSSLAQDAPGEAEIASALQVELPPYWSIDSVDVRASLNDGDAVQPRYRQRFVANVTSNEDLFVQSPRDSYVGPFAVLTPAGPKGDVRSLYGIAHSTLSLGSWRTEFVMENTVGDWGKPRWTFADPSVVMGTARADRMLAVLREWERTKEELVSRGVAGGGASQSASPQVRWRMASAFPGEMVLLGDRGRALEERIRVLSGGTMELKFFEPGALVPALEIFDAVSTGAVDAGWAAAGYWAGKIPAAQFFTAVPFGPSPGELLAWMYHGGGKELQEELYARHNLYAMPCNLISPEGSGWFREPIESLDDFKGLKMRFFGLGARAMEKLGASIRLLAGGGVYRALELGTIDATEFSMPAIDKELGFHEIARHYYFPGWHQPIAMGELTINLDNWNGLTDTQREIVEAACKESMLRGFAQGEAIQFGAMQELQAAGVTFHRWPDEILDALEAAWLEVAEEQAAADEDFARVWASLSAFREDYKLWGELGYLN